MTSREFKYWYLEYYVKFTTKVLWRPIMREASIAMPAVLREVKHGKTLAIRYKAARRATNKFMEIVKRDNVILINPDGVLMVPPNHKGRVPSIEYFQRKFYGFGDVEVSPITPESFDGPKIDRRHFDDLYPFPFGIV